MVARKKWLKSVYIYGSYRKIKTGLSLFLDHPVSYMLSRAKHIKTDCGQEYFLQKHGVMYTF